MLSLQRCHGRTTRRLAPAALVLCTMLLAAESARAGLCEVIDFSTTKQRSQNDGLSTLVAVPAAAPGESVVLEADFGCVVNEGFDPVPSNNGVTVEVLKSVGGAFADPDLAGSFESFPAPTAEVFQCVGSRCGALRFVMPDSGLAGPARISVTRAGNLVARVFELATRTASCDVDAPDALLGTFTLLPPFNALAVSTAGASNSGLKAALAGNGSLLLPMEFPPFGVAAVDASATRASGPEIDKIPDERFVRSLSRRFRPLPAIHRVVPFGAGKALFATQDVPRGTFQLLQVVDEGLPSEASYPENFHDFRLGAAGPIVVPNPITLRFEGASPVTALRSSTQAVALGLSEELLGDLNLDADASDLLLSATDIPSGITTDTDQAIAQVAASPARPVVAVVDDVVAFLQSEALSGHTDLNGDGVVDDLVARVLRGGLALNPGVPVDTSADPQRAVDGSQLAISQGFVFFRTPENATAPQATSRVSDVSGTGGDDTSDQPSIDGLAEHVAYASRAANLAGASGADSQILVTDLFSGVHALVSAGSSGEGNADSFEPAISSDGDHVSFTSRATNLAALGGGGGSSQVVWERGTNVQGAAAEGFALALFELAPGEEDVPGVDYSPCTAVAPGLAISFAEDGTVAGVLFAPDGPACQFEADFSGTYAVLPDGPIQVGSVITVDAAISSFEGVPPLDPNLSDLTLAATNIVTAVAGASFEFEGSFALGASTSVANTVAQVYVRALSGGPVELVSAALGGGGGTAASGQSAPSGDGQLVAFASLASDLVASDTNGASDAFVRDLASDTTSRVSVSSGGAQANGASSQPAITPDGNLIAFSSLASNLVGAGADTNGASDVFLRDRAAGTTTRISLPAAGGSANGASAAPDLSDDGRFVVFESGAALVPEDTNAVTDVYLRDRVEGSTQRVSVKSGGEQVLDGSFDASISGDGNFIVFTSFASLVPGAPPGANVYRRNRITGTVELLSVGASAGDSSVSPDASGDGRTVAFASDASLVLNDSLPVDVFVRRSGFGADLNGDDDDLDTVFQSFATDPLPGLQGTANVAAANARSGFGRAVLSVPEADQGGSNLNETSLIEGAAADGDADTDDVVLHLWDGAAAQLVNLGIAGTQGALSDTTLCALVDEAQQNGAELGGAGGAGDQVLVAGDIATLLAAPGTKSLVNAGIAATQVHVAGTLCVFTRAADGVLAFYDVASARHVSSGLPATAVQVGPEQIDPGRQLVGFRVPEGVDLNGDGDSDDEVMHVVAMGAVLDAADGAVVASQVTNLGLHAIDCLAPGCEAFKFGSIRPNGAVSFLGTEPGESRDDFDCLPTLQVGCDLNGDADALDEVVHYVQTVTDGSQVDVTSVGSLALSTCELETSPHPTEGPEGTGITIPLTECEAARIRCEATRNKLVDSIGPPLTECEAQFDVEGDSVLDCTECRSYVGLDDDGDGVPDFLDNAPQSANTDQGDADGDGVGDAVDQVPSVPPCEKSCDLDENGSIDQLDVDAILAAIRAGEVPQGGVLSEVCGDRRDRNGNRRFEFQDASLCKADCDRPDCSPPPAEPFSAPASSSPACGIGLELAGLISLLMAARRLRRRGTELPKRRKGF